MPQAKPKAVISPQKREPQRLFLTVITKLAPGTIVPSSAIKKSVIINTATFLKGPPMWAGMFYSK